MRQFTIIVSNCGECPFATKENAVCESYCNIASSRFGAYIENNDHLTSSCPMWAQAVEVDE